MYGFHKINKVNKLTAMQHRLPTHSKRRRTPRQSAACRTRVVRDSENGPPPLVDANNSDNDEEDGQRPSWSRGRTSQSPLLAR
jgi:hypothetical protein